MSAEFTCFECGARLGSTSPGWITAICPGCRQVLYLCFTCAKYDTRQGYDRLFCFAKDPVFGQEHMRGKVREGRAYGH